MFEKSSIQRRLKKNVTIELGEKKEILISITSDNRKSYFVTQYPVGSARASHTCVRGRASCEVRGVVNDSSRRAERDRYCSLLEDSSFDYISNSYVRRCSYVNNHARVCRIFFRGKCNSENYLSIR